MHNKKTLLLQVKQNRQVLIFTLPAIITIVIMFIFPFFSGIRYACFNWNGLSNDYQFVGLANFRALLKDETFLMAVKFSLKVMFWSVIIQNFGGLLLALLLDAVPKLKTVLRTTFFLPNVFSAIVVVFAWQFLLTEGFSKLYEIFGWNFLNVSWFSSPALAGWAIILTSSWGAVGYYMLIYFTGLQAIDQTYLEAAMLDGASWLEQVFRIKLPLIMPSFIISLFTSTMNAMKSFDCSYLMTKGAPFGSTKTIAYQIYYDAYQAFKFSYASAESVVFFLLILVFTGFELFVLNMRRGKS